MPQHSYAPVELRERGSLDDPKSSAALRELKVHHVADDDWPTYLKSSLQGWDFTTLSSAREGLAAAHYIRSEVHTQGISVFRYVKNDFCRDWMPLMTSLGFELVQLICPLLFRLERLC